MSQSKNGIFVLKLNGSIVRTVEWNHRGGMFIAFDRHDKKILFFTTEREMKNHPSPVNLIARVTKSEVKKASVDLMNGLCFSFESDPKVFDKSIVIEEDSSSLYKESLRWSFIGHIAVLVLVFALGYFLKDSTDTEIEVVRVVKQIRPVKKKIKTKKVGTTKARKSKPKKAKKNRKYAKFNQKKRSVKNRVGAKKKKVSSKKRYGSRGSSKKQRISRVRNKSSKGKASGALAALNSSSKKIAGANLNSIGASGRGFSDKSGSGRPVKTLYGKGLKKSAYGNGKSVGRYQQGYSTRGVGGGGSAAYGEQTIKGGGGNYSQPLYTEALVQGGLDRSLVDAVIRRNKGKFTYCYEKGLQSKPTLSGRVSLHFIISPSGRVSTAQVKSSSLNYKSVENCMISQMKTLKFPKPVGNLKVKVTYPFQLQKGYLARR
tara:strand:+ start:140173 stop:141462 length:1290 start_codon:yes stop_codon:yes gene_type:complete